ncbi:MAG: thiolase family protein [Candidatus Marinimicrobia bacterium]|nr:thiolase family protein [Candidatus Neomarinimicrobiota bacterium]
MNHAVIVNAKRTPVGSFQGELSTLSAPELGAKVIKNILSTSSISVDAIDEVIMGNVLSSGIGQAPARQAAIYSGLPNTVECLTINKMCGSGLKAVMLGEQAIKAGDAHVVIAGGMESMTNAPYLLPKARAGFRLGHGKMVDSIIHDGLWDAYNDIHMGNCAEICARDRNYTREEQDVLAIESYQRAQKANSQDWFRDEIVPIEVKMRKGNPLIVDRDEEPTRAKFEKIPKLRPAFEKDGTVTAANASKINDGAAAILIMSETKANELGLIPLVKIMGQASAAHAPEWFTTAPGKAISKVLDKTGLSADDIDLWEINEAFAPVAMAAMDDFNLSRDKVNIQGGAIAIGHPIGASGARILTTLIHAMLRIGAKRGLATLCIGGGEASAIIVETL